MEDRCIPNNHSR